MDECIFCSECRDDCSYHIEHQPMHSNLKGQEYHYIGQLAICDRCGSTLSKAEIIDSNLDALYAEYRKSNGLISLEDTRAITTKYDIGKRPLSLILGWGEPTYTRYFDGHIPSKRNSEQLIEILNNPEVYLELLEKNKAKIADIAYLKSKKAALAACGLLKDVKGKIDAVAEYIIATGGDITHLALQKALYYCQGFCYAFTGSFLFEDDCEAWVHGPVYDSIYQTYRNNSCCVIEANGEVPLWPDENEKSIIDATVKHFCCYSGPVLEDFTHREKPWLLARKDLLPQQTSKNTIEKEKIAEFFLSVKENFNMEAPDDCRRYASAMFKIH